MAEEKTKTKISTSVIYLDEGTKKSIASKHEDVEKLKLLEVPTSEAHSEFLEVAVLIPSRNVTGQYMKWADQNPKKAQEILVRGCVLTGKERIEADDFMFNWECNLNSVCVFFPF